MMAPERVQCCIVNDILQHLTNSGRVAPEPSPYRLDAENNVDLSGVIVRAADRTSAAIGFHQDPDSTQSLVLSEPIFVSDAAHEVHAAWFRLMLSAVVNHAKQYDFAQIRFLEWEAHSDDMPWISKELAIAQFSARASVVGWRTTAEECLLRSCPVATVRLSTADLNAPDHHEIADALDRILEGTDDLMGLAAPNAKDLLQKWSSQGCTLLVADTETGVAGLCAFAFKPSRDGDSSASGQIEYLGVRKELQRQGVATQMLYYLCRGVSRGSNQTIDITAFADETNVPANSFYRQSGFEPLCRGKLWYREVNHHMK